MNLTNKSSGTEPEVFLVIGTFGNSNLKEDSDSINTTAGDSSSSQDCVQEFTLENLQNELNKYFQEQVTEQKENTIDQINHYLNSLDNNRKSATAIGKKGLVFLLKKMLLCRSGFQPPTNFKDLLSTESRMEKILRATLHKKLNLRGSSSAIFIKKYLENRHMPKSDNREEEEEGEKEDEEQTTDAENGSKWNKTDSEYIVLEI